MAIIWTIIGALAGYGAALMSLECVAHPEAGDVTGAAVLSTILLIAIIRLIGALWRMANPYQVTVITTTTFVLDPDHPEETWPFGYPYGGVFPVPPTPPIPPIAPVRNRRALPGDPGRVVRPTHITRPSPNREPPRYR